MKDLWSLRIQVMMDDIMTSLSWENISGEEVQAKLKLYRAYIIAVRMVRL